MVGAVGGGKGGGGEGVQQICFLFLLERLGVTATDWQAVTEQAG